MPTRVVLRERPSVLSTSRRRIGGNFRSSLSIKSFTRDERLTVEENLPQQPRPVSDIRSSPRLAGYLFTCIASGVMLASVLQFFENKNTSTPTVRNRQLEIVIAQSGGNSTETGVNDDFVNTPFNAVVQGWKLYGALTVSIFGVAAYLLIILAHMDTVIYPKLWKSFFKDGSIKERNLLCWLILFWAAALHICTSIYSVGYVQANVYFTCWICFLTACFNLNVWRAAANLPKLGSVRTKRETTRNWLWTCIFALATSLALSDVYVNRSHLNFVVKGVAYVPPKSEWIRGLCLTFGVFTVSALIILVNEKLDLSYQCKLRSLENIIFNWKGCEGVILLSVIVVWGWLTAVYTGVSGAVHGPGNVYFGLWCTFFSSFITLGTWLKELGVVDLNNIGVT